MSFSHEHTSGSAPDVVRTFASLFRSRLIALIAVVREALIPIRDAVLGRIRQDAAQYIPVGPMGVPLTGTFSATSPQHPAPPARNDR